MAEPFVTMDPIGWRVRHHHLGDRRFNLAMLASPTLDNVAELSNLVQTGRPGTDAWDRVFARIGREGFDAIRWIRNRPAGLFLISKSLITDDPMDVRALDQRVLGRIE